MPHFDANGLRFHVQVLRPNGVEPGADRPKVVMVHGLVVDNMSSWYYTIANPVGLVADTYLYDMRGHGRSTIPETGYAVVDHVADLRALLSAWEIDQPVHLVGNSFGCVVALSFAKLFPDKVASLVLIEGHFATASWGEDMTGTLNRAVIGLDKQTVKDWLDHNATRKLSRLAARCRHLLQQTSLIDDLRAEEPFPRRELERIACPVLAIYGEGSDILDRARDLERYVPDCSLYVVPDCTHSVLTEAPPFVRERVVDWIGSLHPAVPA